MKKSRLFLALSLMLCLGLGGCKSSGSSSKAGSSSSESTSEVTSSSEGDSTSSSEGSDSSSSSSSEEPEVTGLSPEEAAAEVAACWGGTSEAVSEGVYGAYGAFPAASYSVEDMKGYVASLFVPEEFELAADWSTESDGSESCAYINAVATVLQFYVYAETLWVDGDGYIVDEGTEGATAVEATCIEVYSFTAEA